MSSTDEGIASSCATVPLSSPWDGRPKKAKRTSAGATRAAARMAFMPSCSSAAATSTPAIRWETLPETWLARTLPRASISAYAVFVPPPSTPRNIVARAPGMDGHALHDAADDAGRVGVVRREPVRQRLTQRQHLREHHAGQHELEI